MLRIIAGISRRTISLSRPVLVAERNEMKNPDILPSGTRGSHIPDGFSFQKSDLIKAIQSHLTDALVEVTDTSDGCGSNFNIQVYLPDILYCLRGAPVIHGLFQVISDAFEGKRPVNRQRMVNKAIKEYTPDIHALRVTALTNSEAGKDCSCC